MSSWTGKSRVNQGEFIMTKNNNYWTGFRGGSVDTNGMSSQQKQQTDADVNKGKSDAAKK